MKVTTAILAAVSHLAIVRASTSSDQKVAQVLQHITSGCDTAENFKNCTSFAQIRLATCGQGDVACQFRELATTSRYCREACPATKDFMVVDAAAGNQNTQHARSLEKRQRVNADLSFSSKKSDNPSPSTAGVSDSLKAKSDALNQGTADIAQDQEKAMAASSADPNKEAGVRASAETPALDAKEPSAKHHKVPAQNSAADSTADSAADSTADSIADSAADSVDKTPADAQKSSSKDSKKDSKKTNEKDLKKGSSKESKKDGSKKAAKGSSGGTGESSAKDSESLSGDDISSLKLGGSRGQDLIDDATKLKEVLQFNSGKTNLTSFLISNLMSIVNKTKAELGYNLEDPSAAPVSRALEKRYSENYQYQIIDKATGREVVLPDRYVIVPRYYDDYDEPSDIASSPPQYRDRPYAIPELTEPLLETPVDQQNILWYDVLDDPQTSATTTASASPTGGFEKLKQALKIHAMKNATHARRNGTAAVTATPTAPSTSTHKTSHPKKNATKTSTRTAGRTGTTSRQRHHNEGASSRPSVALATCLLIALGCLCL